MKLAYDKETERLSEVEHPSELSKIAVDDASVVGFHNLPFPIRTVSMLDPSVITTFEQARVVFLRAAAKLEVAKRHFVMDGEILFNNTPFTCFYRTYFMFHSIYICFFNICNYLRIRH